MTDVSKVQKHVLDYNNLYFLNNFDGKLRHPQKLTTPPFPISVKFHPLILSQLPSFSELSKPCLEFFKKFQAPPPPPPNGKKKSPPYVRLALQQILTWKRKDASSFFVFMPNTFLLTFSQ